MVVISRYPAAGLREVNVSLDSDDITVKSADGTDVVIEWEAGCKGVEQPTVTLEEHTLSVRRANPDVFKTFFSVFQKEGGKVTVRVPARLCRRLRAQHDLRRYPPVCHRRG